MKNNYKFFLLCSTFVAVAFHSPILMAEDLTDAQTIESLENQPESSEENATSPLSEEVKSKESQDPAPAISDDVSKVESRGLLYGSQGLGSAVYYDSKRSDFVTLLNDIPARNNWAELQNLENKALLTAADASILEGKYDLDQAPDLLTLRLRALLKRGLIKQAFELYTLSEEQAFNEPIAHEGILSMLFNNEKALACVDTKTLTQRFSDIDFWKFMNAYCALTLMDDSTNADVTSKELIASSPYKTLAHVLSAPDIDFTYTPQSFDALDMFERAALVAEKKIKFPPVNPSMIKNIPGEHVQVFLTQNNLSLAEKMILTGHGIMTGVLAPSEMRNLMKEAYAHLKDGRRPAKGSVEELTFLLTDAEDKFWEGDKTLIVKDVFATVQSVNPAILVPFIPILQNSSALEFSPQNIEDALNVFLQTGNFVPARWIEEISSMGQDGMPNEGKLKKLTLAAYFLANPEELTPKDQDTIQVILSGNTDPNISILKNIIENIDNTDYDYANVTPENENGFDTVENNDYTLPPVQNLKELWKASQDSAVGKTVLLSASVMKSMPVAQINGKVFTLVTESLKKIGLIKSAKSLIAQAILEMQE